MSEDRDKFHRIEAIRWFNEIEQAADDAVAFERERWVPVIGSDAFERITSLLRESLKLALLAGFDLAGQMVEERYPGAWPLDAPPQPDP